MNLRQLGRVDTRVVGGMVRDVETPNHGDHDSDASASIEGRSPSPVVHYPGDQQRRYGASDSDTCEEHTIADTPLSCSYPRGDNLVCVGKGDALTQANQEAD